MMHIYKKTLKKITHWTTSVPFLLVKMERMNYDNDTMIV